MGQDLSIMFGVIQFSIQCLQIVTGDLKISFTASKTPFRAKIHIKPLRYLDLLNTLSETNDVILLRIFNSWSDSHDDIIYLSGQLSILYKNDDIIPCSHDLTSMPPLFTPGVLYSNELQVIISITQTPESIAQCGAGWMTAKSSASDPVIDICALYMYTVISFESLTSPIFQPNFPYILRPWSVLQIAEFGEANVILIRNRP